MNICRDNERTLQPLAFPMMNRGEIRARYRLNGNVCTDCLCACCCKPCDQIQRDKEITSREEQRFLGLQPSTVVGMHYHVQH
jgi:Cys-rich protein (TIGR01571 family)